MTILLNIETHVYAEEQLCDEMLNECLGDDVVSCGIVGPEIILPLRKKRHTRLLFNYSEESSIKDVVVAVYTEYGLLQFAEMFGIHFAFLSNGLRYWIDNPAANFKTIIDKYLDTNGSGEISVGIYVSADAGRIDEKNGIRYYMKSKEKGRHHEPHVHVFAISSCKDASVIIRTGEVIGDFPKKLARIASERVLSEQKFFLEKWNLLTDGLSVDVDHYLGLINY
jgi:hypothetical protein